MHNIINKAVLPVNIHHENENTAKCKNKIQYVSLNNDKSYLIQICSMVKSDTELLFFLLKLFVNK